MVSKTLLEVYYLGQERGSLGKLLSISKLMNSKSKAGFFILQVMLVKTGLLHKYLSQKAGVSFQSAREYIERKCCGLLKVLQAIESFFVF